MKHAQLFPVALAMLAMGCASVGLERPSFQRAKTMIETEYVLVEATPGRTDGAQVLIEGVRARPLGGAKLELVEVTVFADRDGDGRPDPGEERFHGESRPADQGRTPVVLGKLSLDTLPVLLLRVEVTTEPGGKRSATWSLPGS